MNLMNLKKVHTFRKRKIWNKSKRLKTVQKTRKRIMTNWWEASHNLLEPSRSFRKPGFFKANWENWLGMFRKTIRAHLRYEACLVEKENKTGRAQVGWGVRTLTGPYHAMKACKPIYLASRDSWRVEAKDSKKTCWLYGNATRLQNVGRTSTYLTKI